MTRAAIWARVSDEHQSTDAQLAELREWARNRRLDVVAEYVLDGKSAFNGKHRAELDKALQDARAGKYDVLLCWALDRLSREGIGPVMILMQRFTSYGVQVWALQDPWTEMSDPRARELVMSVMAWVAEYESHRRSERIRMGMAARKAKGLPVGRQAGAGDKRKRQTGGYKGNRNAARPEG